MRTRSTLIIFIFIFTRVICHAQETDHVIHRMQDSVNAMHQRPRHMNSSATPFLSHATTFQKNTVMNLPYGIVNKLTNTICTDTSRRSFLVNDTAFFYTRDPYPSADGNFFLSGEYSKSTTPFNLGGFLMKLDHKGNVLWHRTYRWTDLTQFVYLNYYRVTELQDGSIFLGGSTYDPVTQNDDIIFTKTDMLGNVIWSKIYKSRLWGMGSGSTDYYYIQQMKQDLASGDMFLTGPTWADGRTLMRVNTTNGNIAWSKAYKAGGNFDSPLGLDITSNEIRLFSRSSNYHTTISMTRIDKLTGDTIQCKYWHSSDTALTKIDLLSTNPLAILANDHYVLSGRSYGEFIYLWNGITPFYQASVIEFDNDFNFIKAYNFKNAIESNSYNNKISTYPDGSSFFTMMHVYSGYTADVYSLQLLNGQILKQRKQLTHVGIPYEPTAVRAPDGGDLLMRLVGDTSDGISKVELLNLHASDTSSACLGISDNSTWLYPFIMIPEQYYTYQLQSDVFEETTNHAITSVAVVDQYLPGCTQVSYCDSIKLMSSAAILCPSQTLQVTGHRNTGCGSNITWHYNTTGVSQASHPNDSTLTLQFNGVWAGYIYGSISGCAVITDSVFVTVLQAPATLSLGNDFSLCAGNTNLLNAHSGYASYLWQDGSTDSTFLVTQPGSYHVTATDACGVIVHDTIQVLPHTPVLVSLGPDRIKCNNDTLILQAPAGFISYSWSPNYNINALNMQAAIVNPVVDTAYIIKAEAEPGCFGFDTLKVTVFHSPAIGLGADTSFCTGQSIILSAGTGFSGYSWNTGSMSDHIHVDLAGTYNVIGTTAQGCRSYDTLKVLQVYNKPVVTLDHNDRLCQGASKTLDAGTYSVYLWQNNSTGQTITVNGTGIYYVSVTDSHGCKGTDTTRINTILPLPTSFLPGDSTKCNYEKIILSPVRAYNGYLWNTNSTAASISITQPGLYWLDASDQNGCTGRDSILVKQKECLKGLFVPNAFSPNADGKNDRLKALLFGAVEKFEFSIYNRYGQLVFFTKDVNTGWDGMYKGALLDQATFVWKCRYKLEGVALQEDHGTFILLK